MRLILASASPRRRHLLEAHGYDFRTEPAEVEECAPPYLTVGEVTLFNARLKAAAVAARHPETPVLGVDTLVSLEDRSLGKPVDLEEAARMLRQLSGRTHEVYSGLCLIHRASGTIRAAVEVSRVRFRPLDEAEIARYLARIEPLDKAGAYAAQDDSPETVVAAIEGSRTNVIGLPMGRLKALLQEMATVAKSI